MAKRDKKEKIVLGISIFFAAFGTVGGIFRHIAGIENYAPAVIGWLAVAAFLVSIFMQMKPEKFSKKAAKTSFIVACVILVLHILGGIFLG